MRTRFNLPLLGFLCACSAEEAAHAPHAPAQHPTSRIEVPDPVRRNLGIEFVTVARRRVASTLRFAGHFELVPTARQEVRSPVAGRVTLLVEPLRAVRSGDVVCRVDAPEWRSRQRELGEIETQRKVHVARLAALQPLMLAHGEHEASLGEAIAVLGDREKQLLATQQSLGGQARELAETRSQLALLRSDLAEAHEKGAATAADVAEAEAQLAASGDRFRLALESAAALTGESVEGLLATSGGGDGSPRWRTLAAIEVRAAVDGVVGQVHVVSGAWLDVGELAMSVSDLRRVRFLARGLQSDLPNLRNGLVARAVPALGPTVEIQSLEGELLLGAEADPAQRTIDLYLEPKAVRDWARPGVAGFLEIETEGTSEAVLAIPMAATLQDGLQRVLFRRATDDPDEIVRIEADLGVDDGRWVEVKSGLRDGDQVVLAGAYELMLASSGAAPKGGHVHPDGTFHEGEDK